VGVITGGAVVEREVPVNLGSDGAVRLSLHEADFTTATRMARVVNDFLGNSAASTLDSGTVEVQLEPQASHEQIVALLAGIETLDVTPDRRARVIVNERTGTVVMGEEVRIAPVGIAHGSLQVTVKVDLGVSQPAPFSAGRTVVVPDSTVQVQEGEVERLNLFKGGVSLRELVTGLNALGITPQDLIAVLQAIKSAGALDAELEIM
jgi:flagellar P-ring protein precursor FlgI